MGFFSFPKKNKAIWLDLGSPGYLIAPPNHMETWQDHGLGLLRTVLHNKGIYTDVFSTRLLLNWNGLGKKLEGYDILLMNVRSYTFPFAKKAAEIFKQVNPKGKVLTGGMHATVALDEMLKVPEFDKICQGSGEQIICDLVTDPDSFPRHFQGQSSKSMDDWPMINRELWPKAAFPMSFSFPWPLEPEVGWGPGPLATIMTSRVCPWRCSFCNESSYIPTMGRRSVDSVIDELNFLDKKYGVGSVVIHDSMFFQHPTFLQEWIEKYPRKARKLWPYWAAARSDTVRKWPDLFSALVTETNWNTVSIGFESGSDNVLKTLNKECTSEDNYFTIDLLNKIADDMKAKNKIPPKFWANIMFGAPGETHKDAFDTIKMLRHMRYVIPSISYYAPYPGSALGYQLIAEGKSLMSKDNYHRSPSTEKLLGVDYPFYAKLLEGKLTNPISGNRINE